MVKYSSLGDLEDAQQQERRIARQRIESAEEYVAYYRSRIHLVQETFYELSARHGIHDDPGFRAELQRVADMVDENSREAGRKIGDLEEEYDAMTSRQVQEHERFLEDRRMNG